MWHCIEDGFLVKFTVHGGSFGKGTGSLSSIGMVLPGSPKSLPTSLIQEVEVATQETVKRLGGTLGWGLIGSVALGPVGLLAGLLAGGRSQEITFLITLTDGRQLIATGNKQSFVQIKGAALNKSRTFASEKAESTAGLAHVEASLPLPQAAPENVDPLTRLVSDLSVDGWQVRAIPRPPIQRHSVLTLTKGHLEVAVAYTPGPITQHDYNLMETGLAAAAKTDHKIMVGASVGVGLARLGKQANIIVTTNDNAGMIIAKLNG